MKRPVMILWMALTVLAIAQHCQAALIQLTPSKDTVFLGERFSVDVSVSGIDTLAGDELALFDLDVIRDESVFDYAAVSFGTSLGGASSFFDSGFGPFGLVGPNTVFETHDFLAFTETDLQSAQAGVFNIFTLTFDALSLATRSEISLRINPEGFLDFDAIDIDASISPAFVSVVAPATQVPEPSLFWLMAMAIFILVVRKQQQAQRTDAQTGVVFHSAQQAQGR